MIAGSSRPTPSELLGFEAMAALLDRATELADVVIIDSPPVLAVAAASVLGNHLEPDRLWNRAHLEATRDTLTRLADQSLATQRSPDAWPQTLR